MTLGLGPAHVCKSAVEPFDVYLLTDDLTRRGSDGRSVSNDNRKTGLSWLEPSVRQDQHFSTAGALQVEAKLMKQLSDHLHFRELK